MIPEDSPPIPFASQCRISVPTASRYIVSRQKSAILFTVLQQSLVDLSVKKKKQKHINCYISNTSSSSEYMPVHKIVIIALIR